MIFEGAEKSFVSVPLASDINEGKGDKKAIDEDLSHGKHEPLREEREEQDKVTIFE